MAKYDKKIVDHICTLISKDSYTIAEICGMVGISERSYYEWQSRYSDFAESIKSAQDKFDELILSEAKKSLVKMIKGYTFQEKHTTTADTKEKDEHGKPVVRVKEHKVIEKHYQPVPAAVIFALCNLDPDNWKNRQDNKVSGDIGIKSSLETLPDDELQKIIDGERE